MSRLVRCEDVTVGSRLRYVGKPFTVVALVDRVGRNGATDRAAFNEKGETLILHSGHTVWAMEETK
jgi:hypothetical protein